MLNGHASTLSARRSELLRAAVPAIAVLALGGCSLFHAHRERPDDFSVKYSKVTGRISAPDWNRFAVSIDNTGKVTTQWASHEGDKSSTHQLDAETYDALYHNLRVDGAFKPLGDNPPCPEPKDGYEDLTVFAKGQYYTIPYCSVEPKRQAKINAIREDVKQVVGQPPR